MFPIYAYTYQFSQYSIQYVTHLWCTLFIEQHQFCYRFSQLLPVSQKCCPIFFCRDLYCDGINMFSSIEFSHIRDFSIFWFTSRHFGTSISILFHRDSKHNVERFSWPHNFQFIDTFSTQNLLLFFNLLLVPLYNLRNWYGNIILFIYLILFFITTRTFVKFIFHSKFIEPSINTHIVKHCDGINMFSSSEFSHTQHFSIFWFISRFFGTSISILFLQRFKTQCREIFLNT